MILSLLNDPDARRSRQEAFARVRGRLTWQTAIGPLADFCRNPYHAADRDIETYAPYRSSDWERLIYDNVQDRHQLAWLRRRSEEQDAIIEDKEALIQEQSATIQDKDKVIYEFRSGRVMRLILGVQEHLRKLVWFGKG